MKNYYTKSEWELLKQEILIQKRQGRKLVFTNGCFDVLHQGHMALLEFVRKQDGFCVLGLNSDESVRRLKGDGRPVHSQDQRAQNLLATGLLDAVVIYREDTPQEITDFLEPDVLIKGGDYRFETIVGAPEVQARGGTVLVFPRLADFSTTNILMGQKKQRNK